MRAIHDATVRFNASRYRLWAIGCMSVCLGAIIGANPASAFSQKVEPASVIQSVCPRAECASPRISITQFELRTAGPTVSIGWEASTRFLLLDEGVRIESVGEGQVGEGIEGAEATALWSREVAMFDFVVGLRHDLGQDSTSYLTAGVRDVEVAGFELNGGLFLSSRRKFSARVEVEREIELGQRLIVRPSVQLDFAAREVGMTGKYGGLPAAEVALRLGYRTKSSLTPYIGVEHERLFHRGSSAGVSVNDQQGTWELLIGLSLVR